MIRRGLSSLLSAYPEIEIVGEADDGPSALKAAADLLPDVVLLDIKMPGEDGVDVAHEILELAPEAKLIFLTAYEDEEYLLRAFRAGAYAYLLKNTSDETVVETIRMVHQGRRLLSPSLVDPLLRQFQVLARSSPKNEITLSEKELTVLKLVAQGATNEEIAKEVYWGERTVKRIVEEIVGKMGARNRTQAVAEAVKRGLI
jgi:DNA-binding NarL/FixJ family response regulator